MEMNMAFHAVISRMMYAFGDERCTVADASHVIHDEVKSWLHSIAEELGTDSRTKATAREPLLLLRSKFPVQIATFERFVRHEAPNMLTFY